MFRGERRFFDVGDVRGHFGNDRQLGATLGGHRVEADEFVVLAYVASHPAGFHLRAGEVAFDHILYKISNKTCVSATIAIFVVLHTKYFIWT